MLPVFQGDGLALVEGTEPVLDCLRQPELRVGLIERGNRRNEIVVDLHRVGGFEDEQRLSARHPIAGLGKKLHHAPGVRRVDGRRLVLVDRDLPFGHINGPKDDLPHRLDRQRSPLCRCRVKNAAGPSVRRNACLSGANWRTAQASPGDQSRAGAHQKGQRDRTSPAPQGQPT